MLYSVPPVILSTLYISTSHLEHEETNKLHDCSLYVMEDKNGFLLHLQEIYDDLHHSYSYVDWNGALTLKWCIYNGFSKSLSAIVTFAIRHDCRLIWITAEGEVYPQLPTYHW